MKQETHLLQALDLTDKILAAIEQQDLDTVSSLDKDRSLIIDHYFKNNSSVDAEKTTLLKQKNDLIVTRLLEMQQQTRSKQIKLNQSQKVSKAYLDNI